MQKGIIKKVVWVALLSIILAAALSGCKKDESAEPEEKLFNIEHDMEETAVRELAQVVCGQERIWFLTRVKGDFIYETAYDNGITEMETIEWQPEGREYFIVNIAERNGTLYAELWDRDEAVFHIRRRDADGVWSDVMSIRAEAAENYAVMGSGFFVDGNDGVYLVNGSSVVRFEGAGRQARTYELNGSICFFQENAEGHVECVTTAANNITLYELTENRAEARWTFEAAAGEVHGIRSSEEEALCMVTDKEFLSFDRESGSLSARADMVRLGAAFGMGGYYDASAGTLHLYGEIGNGGEGLRYSLLSEGGAFTEQRTKLVYGVLTRSNADSTSSIWAAIATFNQENEDYYVVFRDYENNLERLHADMATGNAPDIIDMTYSEYYESYVKNGYLEDLSPYLEESSYRDDILWNVLDAYRVNGGLYMLIPQFQLQGLLIHPEYEGSIEEWDMETFLELVQENRWDKDIFGTSVGNPENFLYYMLSGRQDEFIDWENRTAAFETDEFMDLLALCGEYAEADWSEWTYEERAWNTLCPTDTFYDYMSYLRNVDIYGREYQLYGYPVIAGQAYGIWACADSCAIYTGSSRKEGAWEFIESLLWESNQKYRGMTNGGFPIRGSILKEMAAEAMNETIRLNHKEYSPITENEVAMIDDIIYNRELSRVSIDPDIWSVVQEETAAYFAGDKTAQEVARIIQGRVQIILQE